MLPPPLCRRCPSEDQTCGSICSLAAWTGVTLGQAMLLFPVVFAAHLCEEWPLFPTWAQRYASSAYTRRGYWITPLAGLLTAVLAPILWWGFPSSGLAFALFTFVLIPSMGWNALFHAGATVAYRAYCPGVVTAVALYLTLLSAIHLVVLREGVLSQGMLLGAVVIRGVSMSPKSAITCIRTGSGPLGEAVRASCPAINHVTRWGLPA
jgi:hypothetical protein